MKILYAIQGTGNGHLSRARDIIPVLQQKGELDLLVSGVQADVRLPYEVKYQLKGLCFIFGKKGGVDLLKTFMQANSRRFLKEITALPVENYDLIISDFEPVSAWACRLKGIPCVGLSHQVAVADKAAPQPKESDQIGQFVLKNYAPVSARYGFHFSRFSPHVFTPVIRQQIRRLSPTNEGHYTVYLPSYDDERLCNVLTRIKHVEWEVFSKHNTKAFRIGNVLIRPIDNDAFIESMACCEGMLCGAGFETPAEALYLGKKLMVIPMKNQFEQQCNAAALARMGVPVLKSLKKKFLPTISEWINEGKTIPVDYPDTTEEIIRMVIANHAAGLHVAVRAGRTEAKPVSAPANEF